MLEIRETKLALLRRITSMLLASLGALTLSSIFCDSQHPSQTPATESDAQHKISVSSDLVVLPVTVEDRNGNLVASLQQRDFRVFDDEVEQTIDVFTSEASPLSLVLLIDDDLKAKDAEQMAPSLRAIAAGMSLADEAMVCRFDLLFYAGDVFTSDGGQLVSDLRNAQKASEPSKAGPVPFVTPPSTHTPTNGEPDIAAPINLGSAPTKALDDAIYAAAQLLRDRGRTRRKAILLVSDGINGPSFNHHTYEDTLNALLSENISVYGVAVGKNSYHSKFALMRNYATDSGGDIYYATRSDQLEKLYSRITEQARHEYILPYVPSGHHANSNYHVVKVETTHEGLSVETRRGYYTPPTTSPPNK